MSLLVFLGTILLFTGILNLRTYLQRKRWPEVEASLNLADAGGEAVSAGEIVAIRPKYIYQMHYSYRGRQYVVKMTLYRIPTDKVKLRINPKKPEEAYLDDKTLTFPILSICIGMILILVSIKS